MATEELLLTRCKKLSLNITEYFDGMRYLGDLDTVEQATPAYLSQLAVAMVMDEVAEIGIVSNFTIEDFITDTANFEALFALREKFDKDSLYEYLKSATDQQRATVFDLVDSTADDGDVFLELIHYICEMSPLDMKLAQILQCVNFWTSTSRFREHLNAIRERLDNTDLSKSNITDDNVHAVSALIQKILTTEKALSKCVDILMKTARELDEDILRAAVRSYDHEKLKPDVLHLFATYKEGDVEPPYVKRHHIETNHHIEYWEYRHKHDLSIAFIKENGVMILLALLLDGLTDEQIRQELTRLRNIASSAILDYVLDILDDYGAMLRRTLDEITGS